MERFDPLDHLPHEPFPGSSGRDVQRPSSARRRRDELGEGLRAFGRRLLGVHDSVGARSGWRAIADEADGGWSFYDPDGRYGVTMRLTARPRPDVVDFVAAIYEQGFEAGRSAKLLAS